MHIHQSPVLLTVLSIGLFAGCTNVPYTSTPFTPASIDTTEYAPRVEMFVVALDASSSMKRDYQERQKFHIAKDIVGNLNQTVPPLSYQAALVAFGTGSCMRSIPTDTLYGPAPFERAEFAAGLDSLACAGGITPMAAAIDTTGQILGTDTSASAVVLVSDFEDIDSSAAVGAVNRLKEIHGDNVCLHTVQIGESSFADKIIGKMTDIGACGSAVKGDDISSPEDMANYVAKVLLGPLEYSKNTVSATALFDFDSAVLKEQGKAELRNLAMDIKSQGAKVADIDVIGHTDNIGSAEYNQELSVRRATAVKDYLVSQEIDPSIIDVSGVGKDNPVASNDTSEGRAKNRRVEINVGVAQPSN